MQADGAQIVTIEGIAGADGKLHPMQEAFRDHHGLQCGFCTPGMVMSAIDLAKTHPNLSEETIRAELDGNLCRCTGLSQHREGGPGRCSRDGELSRRWRNPHAEPVAAGALPRPRDRAWPSVLTQGHRMNMYAFNYRKAEQRRRGSRGAGKQPRGQAARRRPDLDCLDEAAPGRAVRSRSTCATSRSCAESRPTLARSPSAR